MDRDRFIGRPARRSGLAVATTSGFSAFIGPTSITLKPPAFVLGTGDRETFDAQSPTQQLTHRSSTAWHV